MAGTRAHVAATAVALRVLLPAYDGPPVTLFRGTTLSEWDTLAFGFSWTIHPRPISPQRRLQDPHRCAPPLGCQIDRAVFFEGGRSQPAPSR